MALLSFRGISTPSLAAQGEQRRFTLLLFNISRDIPDTNRNDLSSLSTSTRSMNTIVDGLTLATN